MARKKQYIEEEVIEKAMNLFWRNGYETTSMQMLEKEMGINKFSIYSSFGNKKGVFLESIKMYQHKLDRLLNKMKASTNGAESIKEYFINFIEFSKDLNSGKGCLVTNTANELGPHADENIQEVLINFTGNARQLFSEKLAEDETKSDQLVNEQADYLIIAMFGFSSATRMFNKTQLDHYIENIFRDI